MDICDACTTNDASYICLCSNPFVRICSGCYGSHMAKLKNARHSLEPIAAKHFLTVTKSISEYRSRQGRVTDIREGVMDSAKQFEACEERFRLFAEKVRTWLSDTEESFNCEKNELNATVAHDVSALDAMQFIPKAESLTSRLEKLLFEPQSVAKENLNQELCCFTCIENYEKVLESLKDAVKIQILPSASNRKPDESPLIPTNRSEPEDRMSFLEKKVAENNATIACLSATIATFRETPIVCETKTGETKLGEMKTGETKLGETISRTMLKRSRTVTDIGPRKVAKVDINEDEVHAGVKCDGCGVSPITGTRWSCYDCGDFDYCSGCYRKEIHAKVHKFVRKSEYTSTLCGI